MDVSSLLNEIKEKLEEHSKLLKEIKAENAKLQEEVLGFVSSDPAQANLEGLRENKTLRLIVEELQFQLKEIRDVVKNDCLNHFSCDDCQLGIKEFSSKPAKQKLKDLIPAIRSKNIGKENSWLQQQYSEELQNRRPVEEGNTLMGTNEIAMSNSIGLAYSCGPSCVIKISNYLDAPLRKPSSWIFHGEKINGPLVIKGNTSEIVSFRGDWFFCSTISSFIVNPNLRIAIFCNNNRPGAIQLGLAFIPERSKIDSSLQTQIFTKQTTLPDVCFLGTLLYPDSKATVDEFECIITNGKYLAKAHMTKGPGSIVHVDIMEINHFPDSNLLSQANTQFHSIEKMIVCVPSYHDQEEKMLEADLDNVACFIEITNGMNVSLINPRMSVIKCREHNFLPQEIATVTRATFFGSNKTIIEAIFSYEIESTDLALLIALRVERNKNSFAAAIVTRPAIVDPYVFNYSMNTPQWKTHRYKIYSLANDEDHIIQMRNIVGIVTMTKEEKSNLRIRILTV